MSTTTTAAPVLEPAAQAFAEATATPPFLSDLPPSEGRALVDEVQSGEIAKPDVDEQWITIAGGPTGHDAASPAARRGGAGRDRPAYVSGEREKGIMEFLVEFEIRVPDGTPASEVRERERAEAAAAEKLVEEGHLLRVWTRDTPSGGTAVLGLYRADGRAELDRRLGALPLYEWMKITITPLGPHPNDPANPSATGPALMTNQLPAPRLTLVYRLEAALGDPLDVGEVSQGQRRIVPLTGGAFTGPQLNGKLLPGASADWQIVLPDGTALGDIRYTLQTDDGALLYVRSRGVRHGSAEVLRRLARGDDVDASEYVFRTSTQIETASRDLDWLNKGVFIGVAGRRRGGVIYETYLVA